MCSVARCALVLAILSLAVKTLSYMSVCSLISIGSNFCTPTFSSVGLSGIQFWEYLANATIPERIQTMETRFDKLLDKTQDGLVENNIPLQRVKRCITRLHASIRYQHIAFIKENMRAITHAESFEEIFGVLNLYWDFLNYTLLEHIVNEFGNNDTKAAMSNYVTELVAFRKATNLSDFITHWPCTGKGPPDMSRLVIKIEKDWSNCTLEDVEQFQKTLTQKLLLPSFAMLLQDAEQGCISLTWLIPSSVVKCASKDIHNTKLDWFKEHHIERLAIDGQDLYSSATFQYSTFLRKLYTSQRPTSTLSSSSLPQKLIPFKLAKIVKKKVSTDEFTKRYLRRDMDDVGSLGTEFYEKSPIKPEEVGKPSSDHRQKLVLIEGAPGVGKTTFSLEFCRKWSKGEILQGHSLLLLLPLRDNNLKEAKTLADLFYHPNSELQQAVVQEVTSNQGQGLAIWLEAWDEIDHEPRQKASVFLKLIHGEILPLATVFVTSRPWASEHLRENCGHRISQHVEILTSAKHQIEHYISKAEVEAQPSLFAVKFTAYLSSNPVIRAAMCTPVTAKMSAEVFTWSQHTESPLPTTMTELFTAFTLKTLVDHLSTHHEQKLKVTTFSDLPSDIYKQFQGLCRMAYEGILNRQQLVFSAVHLPTGFAPLGLMQKVPQLYTEGGASSYHFIHLTLQEYLAAVHISQLTAHEQTRLFRERVNSGHFKMTMRFLAGHTKLANIPPDIIRRLMESNDTKVSCFHFLFEAKDISRTTRILGSNEMVVSSYYPWTPLDYYVTGHAISHSNCSWRLNFSWTSIDDEMFELFCQGCAAPGGTGCRGHISHGHLWRNDITSKSLQSFINIPPHILQFIKELHLNTNKLDGSACDLLAKAVSSMSSLEVLWLGDNPIGSGGAVKVIKALCGSGVKELWLYSAGIGTPDCEALCELLKSSHSLQRLAIPQNNLSSESVASIITGISHNNSLNHLNISNSHFSMANMGSLALVLKDHSKCTLTELGLRDCHISSEGAVKLAAALCMNSTLKYLHLSHNPIGVEGASSMSDMLQHNTSLEVLYLRDDSVGEEGVLRLINSLKHNQTLRKLWLPEKYKSETSDSRIRLL